MEQVVCNSCRRTFKLQQFEARRSYPCPKCTDGRLIPAALALDPTEVGIATGAPAKVAPKAPKSIQAAGPELTLEGLESARHGAIPDRVGDVKIQEKLGAGGMGVVYKGVQEGVGRVVAVKMLTAQGAADERLVARLRREVKSAGKLRHPGIVTIHAAGDHEGAPYFVMDYVEGRELERHLADHPLPLEAKLELLVAAIRAVDYAHGQGIIHRDLKPANLMVDTAGSIKLLDFGLAKDTGSQSMLSFDGEVMGTPSFMSPEQAEGQPVDRRTDVYSLGAILYWIMTNHPPHEGNSAIQTVYQVVNVAPRDPRQYDPRLPQDLVAIATKAMDKAPDGRYATAGELADDLECHLGGQPVRARMPTALERWIRLAKRNRKVVGAVAGALALGLAIALAVWVSGADRIDLLATALEAESTRPVAYDGLLAGLAGDFTPEERTRAVELLARYSPRTMDPALADRLAVFVEHLPSMAVRDLVLPIAAEPLLARIDAATPERQIALLTLATKLVWRDFKPAALKRLKSTDPAIRLAAVRYFQAVPSSEAFSALNALFWDPVCGKEAFAATRSIYDSGLLSVYGIAGSKVAGGLANLQATMKGHNDQMEDMLAELDNGGKKQTRAQLLIEKIGTGPIDERQKACYEAGRGKLAAAAPALVAAMSVAGLADSAAFALVAVGAEKHRAEVAALLGSSLAETRAAAARVLGALGGDDAAKRLKDAAAREADPTAKAAMLEAWERVLGAKR